MQFSVFTRRHQNSNLGIIVIPSGITAAKHLRLQLLKACRKKCARDNPER